MKKFLLALLTAVTAAALFCGAAASVATYSASYDAPAGINTIVVQDSSAAVILQAADIDHIRADYTYTSSYAFESSKLYDFTVAGSTLTVTKTQEPNASLLIQSQDTRSCTLTLQVPRQTLATITVSTTNDSITLNGVSAQTASLTTDNGRIEVSNFNGSTLSGTTRNGKITMSGVTSPECGRHHPEQRHPQAGKHLCQRLQRQGAERRHHRLRDRQRQLLRP